MTDPGPELDVLRCPSCHGTFSPPRASCPRCGQRALAPGRVPSEGVVLAATELANPPAPWPAPHGILLVELTEGMRVLATQASPTPPVGAKVQVLRTGDGYTVR